MAEIVLSGLHTEPIAEYLAALGVLRLVAEQVDAQATGCWRGDTFVLDSALDEDGLVEFFANAYRPTPIVSPWNGGSGFYPPKKIGNKERVLDELLATTTPRLEAYRRTVLEVRSLVRRLGLTQQVEGDEKDSLLALLRSEMSDETVEWFDAVFVLASKTEYAPILMSGGNDANFEFSFNFITTILDLLIGTHHRGLLRAALFGEATPGLRRTAIGHFSPAEAGGTNRGQGFVGHTQVNPWTYVLMLEGALVLSGSVSRRLESARAGGPIFPFVVRTTAVGFASAAVEDSRSEQWLPLWEHPTTFLEVRHLFAEGRAKVPVRRRGVLDQRMAVDGVDFARAVASLGVDRGISAFARFGFQKRNGPKMYFSVPLGRWLVRHSKSANLLAEIDDWLVNARRILGSGKPPTSLKRASNKVESAIMDACRDGAPRELLDLLTALGEFELALGRGRGRLHEPLPSLTSRWWTAVRDDDSVELRLAASLASAGVRPRMSPVEFAGARWWGWAKPSSKVQTWAETASLESNLLELLRRRDIEDSQGESRERFLDAKHAGIVDKDPKRQPPPGRPRVWARLADIADFIDGRVDDRRLEALLRGLALLHWAEVPSQRAPRGERAMPATAFALLALAREGTIPGTDQCFPDTPGLLARAASGRLGDATALALRRLHAGGLTFSTKALAGSSLRSRRVAAALAFPLAPETLELLQARCFPRFRIDETDIDDIDIDETDEKREDLHP